MATDILRFTTVLLRFEDEQEVYQASCLKYASLCFGGFLVLIFSRLYLALFCLLFRRHGQAPATIFHPVRPSSLHYTEPGGRRGGGSDGSGGCSYSHDFWLRKRRKRRIASRLIPIKRLTFDFFLVYFSSTCLPSLFDGSGSGIWKRGCLYLEQGL